MIVFRALMYKAQITLFLALAVFVMSSTAWATTYYVDATYGSDNNDGVSPSTAWKTIAKLNGTTFSPSDSILFKRGEAWREQLTIPSSGMPGAPITFSAYGSGPNPVISGADIFLGWTSDVADGFTAYYTSAPTGLNQAFEDGSRLTKSTTKAEMTTGSWWYDSDNDRLYVRCSGDNNPGNHIIEASQRDHSIQVANKSYIILENLIAEKSNKQGINLYGGAKLVTNINIRNVTSSYHYTAGIRGTSVNYAVNKVTVDNCVVNYNGGTGIYTTNNCSQWTIRRNTVHNNALLEEIAEHKWTAGIRAINPSNCDIIFEDNLVFSNGRLNGNIVVSGHRGYGIWFDTIGSGGIMRRNKVYDNLQHGIRIKQTNGAEVYYNLSYGNNSAGISVSRKVHSNKVYNNIVYDNGGDGIRVNGDCPAQADNVTGNIVKNNISVGNTEDNLVSSFGGENDGTWGYNNVYEYNCFGVEHSNMIEWGNEIHYSTYDAWETAYDGSTHSVESDPQMMDPAHGDFTLQPSSPCIDVGTDVGLTHDFNGTPVLQGNGVDIGAFEYKGIAFAP